MWGDHDRSRGIVAGGATEPGARVLVDEVYLEALAVRGRPSGSAAHLGPEFVVTSSLTKAYGLSGLRCGWAVADPDLARPVVASAQKAFKEIRLKASVVSMATSGKQIKVESETEGQKREELYDRVPVAVGRVSAGYSRTRLAGAVSVGTVVS